MRYDCLHNFIGIKRTNKLLTNIVLILFVVVIQQRQQLNLSPRLHKEWLLTLNNLDSHFLVRFLIKRLNDLTKRPFAYSFLENIPILDDLVGCYYVVEVVIIPAMVLGAGTLFGCWLRRGC